MGVFVVAGGRGSPGVSTTALALAHTWPAERVVRVIEADPAGGTFAARAGVGSTPGLADLVPALRRGAAPSWIDASVRLGDRSVVICAPPTADEAGALVRAASDVLIAALVADPDTDSIIDVGRLTPQHPLAETFRIADRVLVVLRPGLDGLLSARPRLAGWGSDRAIAVTRGHSEYSRQELQEFLGVLRVETLPADRRGAAASMQPVRFARSVLARAASPLSASLVVEALDRIGPDRASPELGATDRALPEAVDSISVAALA